MKSSGTIVFGTNALNTGTNISNNGTNVLFRTTYQTDRFKAGADADFDKKLGNYVISGDLPSSGDTMVKHVLEMPVQTLQDQVDVFSSISNFHWWEFITQNGTAKAPSSGPGYPDHLIANPAAKAVPSSPRNMLMHFLPKLTGGDMPCHIPREKMDSELRFMENLFKLLGYDNGLIDSILSNPNAPPTGPADPTNEIPPDETPAPAPKKRRYTTRVLTADPDDLLEDINLAGGLVQSSVSQRTLFELFSEELISDGTIQWRSQSEDENVVVMNDYNHSSSGQMKPLDFIHVTSFVNDGQVHYKCTCATYKNMHGKALQQVDMDLGETVLPTNFTCMHCRFYATYLKTLEVSLQSQDTLSRVHQKIQQSVGELNSPISVVGCVCPSTTTKFSVFGEGNYSFVHLHFPNNDCHVKCMNGSCSAKYHIKSRVPRGISLRDMPTGKMCPHLSTLLSNHDMLEELFPVYFKRNNPTLDDAEAGPSGDVIDPEVMNIDDLVIKDFDPGVISFNVNEGKWECTSYSTHTPKNNRQDPELIASTQERMKHLSGDLDNNGLYKGPDLCSHRSECIECGERFSEESDARIKSVTVYARYVSIHSSRFILHLSHVKPHSS